MQRLKQAWKASGYACWWAFSVCSEARYQRQSLRSARRQSAQPIDTTPTQVSGQSVAATGSTPQMR
jgi:hypothetical protein